MQLTSKIEKDVKWGLKKEQDVLPLLQSKIKDVRKTEDKFDYIFHFAADGCSPNTTENAAYAISLYSYHCKLFLIV